MSDKLENTVPETEEIAGAAPAPTAPEKAPRKKWNRKWRYGAAATALTVVVIVGVVLLNIVANILESRYPLNLDLTADDTFTISEASRSVAASVTDEVEVIAFQEENYYSSPSFGNDDINTVARQFYEAMKQYQTASGGKVKTKYIEYSSNPTLVAQYKDYEVAEDSILFLSGERYAVVSLSDMFDYDPEYYYYYGSIVVTDTTVERVIATSIRKVSGELAPVVVMTGHGEDTYALSDVERVLSNNAYTTVECDLTKTDKIDVDAITMVIPAPTTDYSNEEIVTIRNWLQQDGEYSRNLVLIASETAFCPNLFELVNEEYGIEVTDEIVYETSSFYNNNYYAYGTIQNSDYTAELQDKQALSLYTRRLLCHKDNNADLSLYNVPLLTFGNTARLVDLTDTQAENVEPKTADKYPLIGMAYAHKQVPSPTTSTTVDSYVMVVGSPGFLNSTLLAYITNAENEDLFMSAFNAFSGDVESVTISSRSVNNTFLTYENATATWVGLAVFTVLLPLIALAIGIVIFLRRRHL